MGGDFKTVNRQTDGNFDEKTTGTTGTAGTRSQNSNSKTTGTTGGTAGGTAGKSDGTTGTAGGTEKEKILDGLALLSDEEKKKYETATDEERKRILNNAKRREKYRKDKENGGQTVRPRKVKKAKNNQTNVGCEQIEKILLSVSTVIASRKGCEHWLLSESEVKAISEPLSNILATSESLKGFSEHSDAIALAVACISIFIPRIFVSVQKKQEDKKIERTGNRTETNVKTTENKGTNRKHDTKSSTNGTGTLDDKPFYGSVLC